MRYLPDLLAAPVARIGCPKPRRLRPIAWRTTWDDSALRPSSAGSTNTVLLDLPHAVLVAIGAMSWTSKTYSDAPRAKPDGEAFT